MKYFDSHCHLQLEQFDADRAEVLLRMQESYVGAVVVGTDLPESRDAVALGEKHDFLWAAVGLHPNDNVLEQFDEAAYLELAQHPKVVAIGECGLDYFRSGGTDEERAAQKKRFEMQIELALTTKKPLIVHCRNPLRLVEGEASAHDDMLAILVDYMGNHKNLQVIIHFATMTGELAQKYLSLGCYLSFPGPITYTDHRSMRDPALGGGMYDESIRVTPMDRILSETDSPFAAPVPHRGQRNEPAYVADVVQKIATVKNIPIEKVARQITLNSQRIFGI